MNVSLLSFNETDRYFSTLLQQFNDNAIKDNFIPSLVLTISMIIIGIPGNVLIIVVYMKRWKKSTSRIFILALAFNDLFNCLFTMPVEIYFIFNIYMTDKPYLCKISRFFTFWTNDGSSLILMGIAVDRLQRICHPFKLQLSISTVKKIVIVSMVASLIVAWPSLFIYGTTNMQIPVDRNKSVNAKICLYAEKPSVRLDHTVFVFFIMVGNSVLDVFFLVVYGIILYHVKNSGRELRKMSKANLYSGNEFCKTSEELPANQNGFKTALKENSKLGVNFRKMSLVEMSSRNDTRKFSSQESSSKPIKRFFSEECLTAAARRKLFAQSRQKLPSLSSISGSRRTLSLGTDHFRKAKTTMMLFSVTVLFIISFVPYTVLMTIRNFDSEYYDRLSASEKSIYQFFIRSYFLSNALNPLIYGYISEHFRTECKSVLKNMLCLRS